MPKRPKRSHKTPEKALAHRTLIAVCLLAAFCVSAYLAWGSAQGGGVPGCGPESDCDKVLTSRWAYVFGLPISYFALPIYFSGLLLLFKKPIPWRPLLAVAVMILIAVVWFVGLQLVAIRAFCKFCMTAHVAGAIGAVLLLRQIKLERKSAIRVVGVAGLASALLVMAQMLSPARGPLVLANGAIPAESNNVARMAQVSTQTVAAVPE